MKGIRITIRKGQIYLILNKYIYIYWHYVFEAVSVFKFKLLRSYYQYEEKTGTSV